MDDLFEWLMVLFFVFQVLQGLYRKVFGGGTDEEELGDYQPLEALAPDAYALMVNESIAQLTQASNDLQELQVRVKKLIGTRSGESRVHTALRTYVRTDISDQITAIRTQLDQAQEVLETRGEVATAAYLNESQLIGNTFRRLSQLWSEVSIIEEYTNQRRNPDRQKLLQIAENVATDLVEPLVTFAQRHGLQTKAQSMIGVLSGDAETDFPNHFLPGHQIVPISLAAISEPKAWLDVVHSTAKGVLHTYPSVAREIFSVLGSTDDPWLPRRQGQRVVLDVRAMFGAWRETIGADALSVMWLGPAYVHGLKSKLERPNNPNEVMDAQTAPDGRRFADHPPAHLRVLLACEVLQTLGFTHTASEIRRDWFECHGESDGMWTETMWGQYLQVPWDQLFVVGSELIRHLVTSPLRSLGQTALVDIEQLAMTPERWHDLETILGDWVTDQDSGGRPSTCLGALLVGEMQYETKLGRLMSRMQSAILHKKTQRRRRSRTKRQVASLDRPITLLECTEALVLRTILNRPPIRRQIAQRHRLS